VNVLIQGLAEKWDTHFSLFLLSFSGKVSHRIWFIISIFMTGIEMDFAKVGHCLSDALEACLFAWKADRRIRH